MVNRISPPKPPSISTELNTPPQQLLPGGPSAPPVGTTPASLRLQSGKLVASKLMGQLKSPSTSASTRSQPPVGQLLPGIPIFQGHSTSPAASSESGHPPSTVTSPTATPIDTAAPDEQVLPPPVPPRPPAHSVVSSASGHPPSTVTPPSATTIDPATPEEQVLPEVPAASSQPPATSAPSSAPVQAPPATASFAELDMQRRLESIKADLHHLANHSPLAKAMKENGLAATLHERMDHLNKMLQEAAGDPQKMAVLGARLEELEKEMKMGQMMIQQQVDEHVSAMEIAAKWRKRINKFLLDMI